MISLYDCPICTSTRVEILHEIACGNFDNSSLYPSVKITVCDECGHVYNRLSSEEIDGLHKYYNEEYAAANIASSDKTGDRPGSANQNTYERYNQLYSLIDADIDPDSRVLDVGCAMGGFLDFLSKKGIKDLSGIDLTQKYVAYAKRNGRFTIKPGNAEAIPFADDSFDIIVMDQVMEHLAEPAKAFQEAKRVLVDGGLFCIGIPDAARYGDTFFFDFYWFIMREHIQHFDIEHLKLLAEQEGFELIRSNKNNVPMMSETMILPDINIVFRSTGKKKNRTLNGSCFDLQPIIEKYIEDHQQKTKEKEKKIHELARHGKPIYAWGIGRECLYLYENAGLKHCNITGLIDTNNHKQNHCVLDGKKITDPTILHHATSDSVLLITAIAHTRSISHILSETLFPGVVLTFDS